MKLNSGRSAVVQAAGIFSVAAVLTLSHAEGLSTAIGTNRVSITVSGGERVISANGLPDHEPGKFPNSHNPNTIEPQNYRFRVPNAPIVAAKPTAVSHALFGIAINGVPFDPATAEFWNGDRDWNYEANTGFMNLGLDDNNAHVQPSGAYHYHALPAGLIAKLNRKAGIASDVPRIILIGWAADGFPIYNNYNHTSPTDPSSPLRKVRSSYRLKSGERSGGPGGKYDGRFTADFEYAAGSGDLDECNGSFGVTPEFPAGIYHYSITEEFPFISRHWRGAPDPSFLRRGGVGPGSGPGRRGGRKGPPRGNEENGRPPLRKPDDAL
jgi:hypothetical protein